MARKQKRDTLGSISPPPPNPSISAALSPLRRVGIYRGSGEEGRKEGGGESLSCRQLPAASFALYSSSHRPVLKSVSKCFLEVSFNIIFWITARTVGWKINLEHGEHVEFPGESNSRNGGEKLLFCRSSKLPRRPLTNTVGVGAGASSVLSVCATVLTTNTIIKDISIKM